MAPKTGLNVCEPGAELRRVGLADDDRAGRRAAARRAASSARARGRDRSASRTSCGCPPCRPGPCARSAGRAAGRPAPPRASASSAAAASRQRALGDERHDRVDRRIDALDLRQVRGQHLARRQLAAPGSAARARSPAGSRARLAEVTTGRLLRRTPQTERAGQSPARSSDVREMGSQLRTRFPATARHERTTNRRRPRPTRSSPRLTVSSKMAPGGPAADQRTDDAKDDRADDAHRVVPRHQDPRDHYRRSHRSTM